VLNLTRIRLLNVSSHKAKFSHLPTYQENKLIQGQAEKGNKRVDLGNICIPILYIYAEQDHLVPPAFSLALKTYIVSVDYLALLPIWAHRDVRQQ
jgi:poly(3-hydroxyalkanoate) synthetase